MCTSPTPPEQHATPITPLLSWRVSWQEGIYFQTVCFQAGTPQKAVDLFQAWLDLHGTAIPARVQFEVVR